jgi:hypothetical protein
LPDLNDVGFRRKGLGLNGLSQSLQILGFQVLEKGDPSQKVDSIHSD